jgi:hypothetical protein
LILFFSSLIAQPNSPIYSLHHVPPYRPRSFRSSSLAIAQARDGGGLRVWPDSGPLAVYADPPSQLSWRYNGELDAWGHEAGLDYVPMIKDDSALGKLSEVIAKWTADPTVTHVLGYKLRQSIFRTVLVSLDRSLMNQLTEKFRNTELTRSRQVMGSMLTWRSGNML